MLENDITNISYRNIVSITDLNKNSTLEISEDSDEKCTICLDKYKNKDIKRILKCNHGFHQGCIDTWLENNTNCPVCRTSVLEKLDRETSV